MAKQKKKILTDEEALKHYSSNEPMPGQTDQPHLKKLLQEALASNPEIIKPDLSIDHRLEKRKTPVIKPASKKKKH